ncbi:hypothetical protein KC333_g19 [Hortaea werneckii]|nr:hypothetical protein KC333_g19 [Hortaea werneckii]
MREVRMRRTSLTPDSKVPDKNNDVGWGQCAISMKNQQTNSTDKPFKANGHLQRMVVQMMVELVQGHAIGVLARWLSRTPNVCNMHSNRILRPITVDDHRCHAFAIIEVVVSDQTRDDFVASLLYQLVELFVGAIRFTGCSADEADK